MSWGARFHWREDLVENLWGVPVLGAVAGATVGLAASYGEEHGMAASAWHYTPSTATAVLSSIIGATAALAGFVITVTVLVVQMAIGTFSARVMRLWYRDRLLKATLALLAATLTLSFSVLRRIDEEFVPDLGVTLAGLLVSVSLLVFFIYFDRCIRRLRPVAVAADVAATARTTFTHALQTADRAEIRWEVDPSRVHRTGAEPSFVVTARHGGAIQAIDGDGLVSWAQSHGSELVVPHAVGDFVHRGGVLVEVYGGRATEAGASELADTVALGEERTFDQDPAFALRVLVDMANKALSAAVNDPTTAIQVIDHIGEVLAHIGRTDLERRSRPDPSGTPVAVIMATRRWDDLVALSLTEIREFGATSIQVVRRLRALLDELLVEVRPEHRAALEEELRRLDATVAEAWRDSVDLDRASGADGQGIGGPPATSRPGRRRRRRQERHL